MARVKAAIGCKPNCAAARPSQALLRQRSVDTGAFIDCETGTRFHPGADGELWLAGLIVRCCTRGEVLGFSRVLMHVYVH